MSFNFLSQLHDNRNYLGIIFLWFLSLDNSVFFPDGQRLVGHSDTTLNQGLLELFQVDGAVTVRIHFFEDILRLLFVDLRVKCLQEAKELLFFQIGVF